MGALSRWEPSRELMTMRQFMDRVLNDQFAGTSVQGFALDVAEEGDDYVVKASVPGVNPEDLDVTLNDNVLTIKGESKADQEIKEENYRVRERRFGSFSRSIALPTAVDASKVESSYENGVLTLHLPKSEAVKPKRINVSKSIEQKGDHKSNGHQTVKATQKEGSK